MLLVSERAKEGRRKLFVVVVVLCAFLIQLDRKAEGALCLIRSAAAPAGWLSANSLPSRLAPLLLLFASALSMLLPLQQQQQL